MRLNICCIVSALLRVMANNDWSPTVQHRQLEVGPYGDAAGPISEITGSLRNPIYMHVLSGIDFMLRPGAGVVAVEEVFGERASRARIDLWPGRYWRSWLLRDLAQVPDAFLKVPSGCLYPVAPQKVDD